VISEGPSIIEGLSADLQNALNGAVPPDEEIVIAVRGTTREAFAATPKRLFHLIAPVITGTKPVEVRETPLDQVKEVRAETRPVNGRLRWSAGGGESFIEYPTYDASKYNLVAARLTQMLGETRTPRPPATAPGTGPSGPERSSCPECGGAIPRDGCWCPKCGFQAADPCWECGRALMVGSDYCALCGTPNTEPAAVKCPECGSGVSRGQSFCAACGAQARLACAECDRPLRRDWQYCPSCGGERAEIEASFEATEPEMVSTPVAAADPARLNEAGTAAYEREDYQEAVRLFREAAEADPQNAGYWTNLGVAHGAVGDDLQAFNAYRRAVELDPGEASAYLFMGQLYLERERYSEARESWEKLIQVAPDSEEAEEARENLRNLDKV
jgi:predicted amidophosphoribosyltransferase